MEEFKTFKEFLKNISFLTEKDCSLFEPYLKTKNYKAKDHVLSEAKVCKEIGFVNKGCFRTYYLFDGKEINSHFAFENEFETDMTVFCKANHADILFKR